MHKINDLINETPISAHRKMMVSANNAVLAYTRA
jgi:hypothetical protein